MSKRRTHKKRYEKSLRGKKPKRIRMQMKKEHICSENSVHFLCVSLCVRRPERKTAVFAQL